MKTKTMALARVLATLLMALCLMCAAPLGAFAETTTNQAVMNDTSGVVQIKLVYIDPNNHTEFNIQSGTGFLINDSTVITCNHVVTMSAETLAQAAEAFGADANVVQNNCKIQISVLRDLTIDATVKNSSAEMDYAILNLSSQLYDRTYLPIRESSSVQQTEEAFALGFPGEVVFFQDVNTYTSDDVTITSGRVNKLNTVGGVDYIQTSTRITSGNSGCPLVDANGAVIGRIGQDPVRKNRWLISNGRDSVPVTFASNISTTDIPLFSEAGPIIASGTVVVDDSGSVKEMRAVIGCYSFPTVKFHRAITATRDIILLNPVEAIPGYNSKKGTWTLDCDALGISISKPSWDECVVAFHEYFVFLWETYEENDGELEGEEAEVRDFLRSLAFP